MQIPMVSVASDPQHRPRVARRSSSSRSCSTCSASGIVIPILPLYAEKLHATDFETGILLAIYSVMQLFFSPIWGRLSDRAGRRPVLLISILGSCGSQLGYALAPSFWWLVVARGFAGVCGANITAAQAYIADVTDEKIARRRHGHARRGDGARLRLRPRLGGFLSTALRQRCRSSSPARSPASTSSLAVVILQGAAHRRPSAPARARSPGRAWCAPSRRRACASLMLLFFVVTFGFANLEATFSLYPRAPLPLRPPRGLRTCSRTSACSW